MWKYSLGKYEMSADNSSEICKNCRHIIYSGLDVYICYTIAELEGLRLTFKIIGPYKMACKSYDNNIEVDTIEEVNNN